MELLMKTTFFTRLSQALALSGSLMMGSATLANGNINAALNNGVLQVTGDGAGNVMDIEPIIITRLQRVGAFQLNVPILGIKVSGLEGTTINGKAFATFAKPTNGTIINLNGGNDKLRVFQGEFDAFPSSLKINMGTGTDDALVSADVNGDVDVTTGGGGDDIVFLDFIDVFGDVTVKTDNGNDQILAIVDADTIDIQSQGGADEIFVGLATALLVTMDSGTGDDHVVAQEVTSGQTGGILEIVSGADDDLVEVIDCEVNDLFVELQGGDDQLKLETSFVDSLAELDGGDGVDELIDLGLEAVVLNIIGFE